MSVDYRNHIDPEYRRWGAKYSRFPGVAECVRLINARKAKGAWADIIAYELAAHAETKLDELIAAYHEATSDVVRLYVLMALEMSRPVSAVPFLTEVLSGDDGRLAEYARRTLKAIDTRESRAALRDAK